MKPVKELSETYDLAIKALDEKIKALEAQKSIAGDSKAKEVIDGKILGLQSDQVAIKQSVWADSQEFANRKIQEINNIIVKFLVEKNPEERLSLLKNIQDKVNEMEWTLSSEHFTGLSQEYQQVIRQELFLAVQTELAALPFYTSPESLSELIAQMSPQKAQLLVAKLTDPAGFKPESVLELYAEEHTLEAHCFKRFCERHTITLLGGSNSRSFVVNNTVLNTEEVLTVENVLGQVKLPSRLMRDSAAAPILTKRAVERPVGTLFLVVTEKCDEDLDARLRANLERLQREPPEITPEKFFEDNTALFYKMADAFINIRNAGFFFPDAKNPNWLIDKNGELRIADCKSLRRKEHDMQECYSPSSMVFTEGRVPPEGFTGTSVDRAHSYIFGVNLLKAFTKISSENLVKLKTPQELIKHIKQHYSELFSTPVGEEYRRLIVSLWSSNPTNRTTMDAAKKHLDFIKQLMQLSPEQQKDLSKAVEHVKNPDYRLELLESYIGHTELYTQHCEINALLNILSGSDDDDLNDIVMKQRSAMEVRGANFAAIKINCMRGIAAQFEINLEALESRNEELSVEGLSNFIAEQRKNFATVDDLNEKARMLRHCLLVLDFENRVADLQENDDAPLDEIAMARALFYEGKESEWFAMLQNDPQKKHFDDLMQRAEGIIFDFMDRELILKMDFVQDKEAAIDRLEREIEDTQAFKNIIRYYKNNLHLDDRLIEQKTKAFIAANQEGRAEAYLAQLKQEKQMAEACYRLFDDFKDKLAPSEIADRFIIEMKTAFWQQEDKEVFLSQQYKIIETFYLLLNAYEALRFGPNDQNLDRFIQEKINQFCAADDKEAFMREEKAWLKKMTEDPVFIGVNSKVKACSTKINTMFGESHKLKLEKINEAFSHLKVEDRGCAIFEKQGDDYTRAQGALAAKRNRLRGSLEEVSPDSTSAARSFMRLKQEYQDTVSKAREVELDLDPDAEHQRGGRNFE